MLEGQKPRVPIDIIVVDFFSQFTAQLLEPTWRWFVQSSVRSAGDIRHRSLTAGLDPENDQQSRYLIAQGIFEVLSAALFYRLLEDHFAHLGPLLSGTSPATAKSLEKTVVGSLREAEVVSGDYATILRLSIIGHWVLRQAPPETLAHWRALLAFVERLDLSEISSDVLGSIFERLISPERRHEMGQHYTQPRLARSMAKWGVRQAEALVLDPTCGAGTFVVETYAFHRAFGLSHDKLLSQTYGNDLDSFAVHLAAINLATRRIRHGLNHPLIRLGDAFDLQPGTPMLQVRAEGQPEEQLQLQRVHLVITNPPYGRSHPEPVSALDRLRKLYGTSDRLPETTGINLGAWFVLLAAGLLQSGGRMAFVLQSAVLQNENLESWRRWIRERWDLVLWHTEDDVWFSDARVATCVVLFAPRVTSSDGLGSVKFVNVQEPASGDLVHLDGVPSPASHATVRDLSSTGPGEDLLIAGTKPKALIEFEQTPNVTPIKQLDKVVTGAGQKLGHAFFKLKDTRPSTPGVLREVKGLGATFRINRTHLTPILSGPKELVSGTPTLTQNWLLTLPPKLPSSNAVREYIAYGRSQGVHEAPSIEARGEAWWSISPRLWDIAVPMNAQFRHQIAWLSPRGAVTNNFNALQFQTKEDSLLAGAALASAFGALARLYISGEVGCEGARRVLLVQFQQWPVLDPSKVKEPAHWEACLSAYEAWRAFSASEIDEMPANELAAWRRLTIAVARAALGPTAPHDAAIQLAEQAIQEARATVARRRRREAVALGGRTRQTGLRRSTVATRVRKWTASSNLFSECVELLAAGPDVFALRTLGELETLGLFPDDSRLSAVPAAEKTLVEILGPSFEAAWPDPAEQAQQFSRLLDALPELFRSATRSVIGDPPDVGSAATATWNDLKVEVQTGLRRQLQSATREALA